MDFLSEEDLTPASFSISSSIMALVKAVTSSGFSMVSRSKANFKGAVVYSWVFCEDEGESCFSSSF